jgi:hypothetical protein
VKYLAPVHGSAMLLLMPRDMYRFFPNRLRQICREWTRLDFAACAGAALIMLEFVRRTGNLKGAALVAFPSMLLTLFYPSHEFEKPWLVGFSWLVVWVGGVVLLMMMRAKVNCCVCRN